MTDVFNVGASLVRAAGAMPGAFMAARHGARPAVAVPESLEGPGIAVHGTFYPVRTLNADDTDVLQRFLQDGLSEESRRRRFMAPMPTVPKAAAAWLADRDGTRRVALAALDPLDPTVLTGVVEYAFVEDGPPEVAVAVADAFQGRGIGKNLLRMLANMSVAAGEMVWRCDVLADNEGPIRLLNAVGEPELGDVNGGVRSVLVELDPHKLMGTTVPI